MLDIYICRYMTTNYALHPCLAYVHVKIFFLLHVATRLCPAMIRAEAIHMKGLGQFKKIKITLRRFLIYQQNFNYSSVL